MGDGRKNSGQMGKEEKREVNHLIASIFLLPLPPIAGQGFLIHEISRRTAVGRTPLDE
jgi:hypothetical protein